MMPITHPFGFAQGRLFDPAWTSLREVHALLRMTMVGWLLWEPRRHKARCPCLLPVLGGRGFSSSLRRDCQRKNERPRLVGWSHDRSLRVDVAVMSELPGVRKIWCLRQVCRLV